jgi:NADPH-dependent glutamate synthase beta subunit-like oxidoreductase
MFREQHLKVLLGLVDSFSEEKSEYKGFCVFIIKPTKKIVVEGGGVTLTQEDKQKIIEWCENIKDEYMLSQYRIDLDRYIFLFNFTNYNSDIILYGNLIERTFHTRLNLAEMYQQSLMRSLIHG